MLIHILLPSREKANPEYVTETEKFRSREKQEKRKIYGGISVRNY